MNRLLYIACLALIALLCCAPLLQAGDCRGVLQIQGGYTQQVQAVQAYQPQAVQLVQAPQYVQRVQVVQDYQPLQVQAVYSQQFVQRQQFRRRRVQRVVVQQPQRVIVRDRVVGGGNRNVQLGLFNFGR